MKLRCYLALALALVSLPLAAEDKAEFVDSAPPKDALSAEVAAALSSKAIKVAAGDKTVCEIWFAKTWTAKADFAPSGAILYPLEVGELVGVVRYPDEAGDFRDQKVAGGVYTLRYGQQPEDGNHVGTSDTRDFLVLLPAKKDAKAGPLSQEDLHNLSKEASKTTHPAILSMLPTSDKPAAAPEVKHYADRELTTLRVTGATKAGAKEGKLTIEFVLVGHAPE
ncbi:MAG: hypothetical protein HYS13_23275 [Planctomycetia bacterium]|nr:hypothetical protein [Planctomycetia bacterium]